jgi:hypothetical protein
LEWLFSERIRLAKFFESWIEIADRQPIASFVCCSPQDEQFQQCSPLSNLRCGSGIIEFVGPYDCGESQINGKIETDEQASGFREA